MERLCTLFVKSAYGRHMLTPVDETAQVFADIANTSTITWRTLERIQSLGFTIRVGGLVGHVDIAPHEGDKLRELRTTLSLA